MSSLRVAVTGAAGQIAYSLLPTIASGGVFGRSTRVVLQLLDIPPALEAVKGVVMELEDCAFAPLENCIVTADPMVAFKDADYAILLGSMPRKEGMDRRDLLKANVGIFKAQGEAINLVSKKSIKVLVVGNPANTNALVCQHYAPDVPPANFTALTRLDQNRATSLIAKQLSLPADKIKNVCIWGNHSNTQFPDLSAARADGSKVLEKLKREFVENEFIKTVAMRGAAVIAARKLSSAMSAARAACDHVRDWHSGTAPGEFVSMAVVSDGSYDIPKGLMFSFPVNIANGNWSVVQGLTISEFARKKLNETTQELENERQEALAHVSKM